MTQKPGSLLLLPNLLGDVAHHQPFLPVSVDKAVAQLDGLIAESDRGGRRYLGRFDTKKPANDIPIAQMKGKLNEEDIEFLLEPIKKGETWGVLSDAGLPVLADPGALLVRRAREMGIQVKAFIGPSSVTHALVLSGLPGQSFHFHGYLEKDPERRRQQIYQIAEQAKKASTTQIFIEAPHRNKHALETLVETLGPRMLLCVAWDLTLPTQGVLTQSIERWRKSPLPNIDKKPAIFLFNTQ